MAPVRPGSREAGRILALARRSPPEARQTLARLGTRDQVALICETPLEHREALLRVLPEPERVIPELPEAELCFTVKAVGLADAGWVLEHARDRQIVAALDLDVWEGDEPVPARLDAWLEALSDAGEPTLLRAAKAIDPELLLLWLRDRVEVWLRPSDDWTPPPGAQSLDSRFYLSPRREDDDLATLLRLLSNLFQNDYWFYFRCLQGVIWELQSETEEWALRWRGGRLQDLGFPSRREAIEVYSFVRAEDRGKLPASGPLEAIGEWPLPIWMPEIPTPQETEHVVLRAAAALDPRARRAFLYAFVALANKVAVADGLPLGDGESLPAAIEKAARIASRGLDHLARENRLTPDAVLRRTTLTWLFRVGASLDRAPRGP